MTDDIVTTTAERLYALLPAIHRIRDAELGYPLKTFVTVIAEQVVAKEENLDQLYDDQFIETCASWAAPYIGDLIGYHSLHGVVASVASPRADVANTIRYRRRKGTASMLEQMARDVTGWPARVVEFFQLLGWTQYMNHVRADAHYAPDLRNWKKPLWRDTAFDTIAHTADVRRIGKGAARHNIPNIGIYLWRVRAFSLTRSPAAQETAFGGGCFFRFNPLGVDTALYSLPETEEEITHLAEPRNVPLPLARRWLKAHLGEYYGPGKSLYLEVPGDPPQPIPNAGLTVTVCDLSDVYESGAVVGWANKPQAGTVAIDPVLGRIAFGSAPAGAPLVSFHYGFTIAIGGGEYERGDNATPFATVRKVSGGAALQAELDAVQGGGMVEATDSFRYAQTPTITVEAGQTVVLRAANGARPLLQADGDIKLAIGAEATLIIDGWVISGGTLVMPAIEDAKPRYLILRDCTLVPGPRKKVGGSADDTGLVVRAAHAEIELERCVTAPLHIVEDAEITLRECIVDATAQDRIAVRAPGTDALAPAGTFTLESCTVIGKVHANRIELASDCLFVANLAGGDDWKAPVWAERRQEGCVRFSYVPPGSLTPRRYHCQPEKDGEPVWPQFTSLRYGDPGYCQLLQCTPESIRRGAHDESEMGVLHGLYQPQRETNLRVRLEEYLRFGLEAGLIYES